MPKLMERNDSAVDDFVVDLDDSESTDMTDEVVKLKQQLVHKDQMIRRLADRLNATMGSKNDVDRQAESVTEMISLLKNQLHLVNSSIVSNKSSNDEVLPVLVDFECQTEWSDTSSFASVECARREPNDGLANPVSWSLNHHHSCTGQSHDADSDCWHLKAHSETNSRLLHVLSDLVKTIIDTEHDIQRHLSELGYETRSMVKDQGQQDLLGLPSLGEDTLERLSTAESTDLCEDGPDLTTSNLLYLTPPSHININNANEDDVVLGASRRHRAAVDRVLKLLSDAVTAHHEIGLVMKRNEELVTELNEECSRRDKLTSQLLHSEERLAVLEKEKNRLADSMIEYSECRRQMDMMKTRIDEYEAERDKWINDNQRLEKVKCSFAQGLPQLQQKLMNDNENLTSDVRQLQQERLKLLQRIHGLALETEQLRSERDEILDEKRRENEDFQAQIEANEKNLASYRRFLEEQTHERETERDEFNKELASLLEKLKEKDKTEQKLRSKLEEMEIQVNSLLEEKSIYERQLSEVNLQLKNANKKISDLRSIITSMEKENEKSNQMEKYLRTKVNDLNEALDMQMRINETAQGDTLANSLLERISSKTQQIQNTLGDSESEDTSGLESSFNVVRLLSERLDALNGYIDKLVVQNNSLKYELDSCKENNGREFQDLCKEKESLERNLTEILRSNEMLQEELNGKHLQLSVLKSRLEASFDSNTLKCLVSEMQNKLLAEEQKCSNFDLQIVSLKQQLEERNARTSQLLEEIEKLKNNLHTIEGEKAALARQNEELKSKISVNEASYKRIKKSNELFQQELKEKDTNLASLKSRIENFVDSSALKDLVNEMQKKLEAEEKKCGKMDLQIVTLKQQLDERVNRTAQLIEEVNKLNSNLQTSDSEAKNLIKQNEELKSKLSSNEASYKRAKKTTEMLQEELKEKNLQLNTMKSRLEPSVEANALNIKLFNNLKRIKSQRNNLLFQKKYLLHVLGGFQMTEKTTLAILANMNVSIDDDEPNLKNPRSRFRSAVFAVIATHRLKWLADRWSLVRKWERFQKAYRSNQNSRTSLNLNFSPSPQSQTNTVILEMQAYVDRLKNVQDTLGLRNGQT